MSKTHCVFNKLYFIILKGGKKLNFNSRFKFVGDLGIPKKQERFYVERDGKTSDTGSVSINFYVEDKKNNSKGWVELFGYKNPSIRTLDTDNKQIEISWSDRLDPDVIKEVAGFKKLYVNLGEEFGGFQTFITEYDMIQYLNTYLPKYSGKVEVKGNIEKNYYNGTVRDRYNITSVYAAAQDKKPMLEVEMVLFYNNSSVDKSDLAKEQKVRVEALVEQYSRIDKKRMLFHQPVVLSQAAYDMENEAHARIWNNRLDYLTKKIPSKKKYAMMKWKCRLVNGAEEIPFDESMLTNAQKEQIMLGVKTVEDFAPKKSVYGPTINEIRLVEPILDGDFADGIVECEESNDEIESRIFTGENVETVEDMMKSAEKPKKVSEPAVEEDDDEEDLF